MKCFSLFTSVAVAAWLGWNVMTPAVASAFEPSYRYEGQPPNRLCATTLAEPAVSLPETQVPWNERLPELRSPYVSSMDAGGGVPANSDTPFFYARQRRETSIGEVEPLRQRDALDSVLPPPESYATQPENWDTKGGWGTTHGWGGRLRQRFGAHCSGCDTLWRAAADFYYLKRSETSPVTILVDNTTRTIEEFNSQSLDFGYNVGYGIRLSRALDCGACLNLGYFGLYGQQAAIELTGDLALVVPGFPTGGNVASYNSDYRSQLHSGEINLRQSVGSRFGLLAGFRYINLQEDLLLSSQLGAVVTLQHYDIDVDNNLFGAQLGTDIYLCRWRALQFDAMVKCGFFLNNASQTTSSALIGPPVSASTDSFAVAGEAGIYATYCINDAWSVRGGYQVLGLHGVALAPQQLQQSNLATGNGGIDATGSVFYSGASLSVQYAW